MDEFAEAFDRRKTRPVRVRAVVMNNGVVVDGNPYLEKQLFEYAKDTIDEGGVELHIDFTLRASTRKEKQAVIRFARRVNKEHEVEIVSLTEDDEVHE